ncbi:hypothetical protein [Nocardioides sp. SYSU D00065]|uniref:hypothetical protein n=1 Tax=Nocardioides sp. SYSU D00065 TaxID=2817378 RepID=UPI001B323082|nr:hypothetical protein [Nocardioides sp. SYSU D00065]
MTPATRLARALPVLAAALVCTSCAAPGDGPASPPSPESPASPTSPASPRPSTSTPGEQATPTWQPSRPSDPVDLRQARRTYAPVLDAAVAALDEATGAALRWSGAEVSLERFAGVCVAKVERSGTGSVALRPADVLDAVRPAIAPHGFDDLAVADDPGGALLLVAHDAEALLELRSRGVTTVAVRVRTTDEECGG